MVSSNITRRATPRFKIQNNDITEMIRPYLSSVEITENLEGSLDELVIKLDNENNKLLSSEWIIPKKTKIQCGIETFNWENEEEGEKYQEIGTFNIDSRQFNRKTATFKAISGPLSSRDTKNSKIWGKVSLKALGKEFADKYKLKFFYKIKEEISLVNIKQEEKEDFSFLNDIAKEQGVKLKITNGILVLFEEEILTEAKPLLTVSLDNLTEFEIKDRTNDVYDAIEVRYFNVKTQKETKVLITKAEIEGKGKEKDKNPEKIYKIKSRSKNEDLKKLAKKTLENINKKEIEISCSMIGCKELYSGCVIQITEAGEFSGMYVVTQIKHKFPKFQTSLEAYKIQKGKEKEK